MLLMGLLAIVKPMLWVVAIVLVTAEKEKRKEGGREVVSKRSMKFNLHVNAGMWENGLRRKFQHICLQHLLIHYTG